MESSRKVPTYCGICEHSCGMEVTVQGNMILDVKGQVQHPYSKGFLCTKGLAAPQIWSAPDRLKAPLKKVNGGWQQIDWDDALKLCAQRLHDVRDRYGSEGLLVYYGQSYLKCRVAHFLLSRMLNLYGAVNISSAGSECFISTMLAHFATFGNLPFPDYEKSSCIILWGSNPCASGGIGKSYPQMISLFREKKRQGTKFIVIDPRRTASAELADIFLQPRPGTDGALALGFIRAILDEHLEDSAYIERYTAGFEKLLEMVNDYPLARIEHITGIGQNDIREAARLFATNKPGSIKVGSGLEHHTNGVQSIRATNILLAITGNVDVAGGNTFITMTPLAPAAVHSVPQDKTLTLNDHPMFVSMVNQAQAVAALDLLDHDTPYPVRGMIIAGGSPLTVLAHSEKLRRIMQKMEFILVVDQFMNETARYADLILPAALFLERDELCVNPLNVQNKIIEPSGPWPDWKIWLELARTMGYGEHFPWKSWVEIIDHMLEPSEYTLQQIRSTPGGIKRQHEVGKVLNEGFYTYSGKIEIYSMSLETNGYDPLPHYHEPSESPVSLPELAARFPLILTTGGRYPVFVHSQHRNIDSLRRHAPEAVLEIHPETACQYGIADGAMVAVESPRGSISIKTLHTVGILPGVVHIPHGWNEANCNVLTDDAARDPISGFPGLKSSLCRIRTLQRQD